MSLTDLFFRFYWAIEQRIVPGLKNSQYVYVDSLRKQVTPAVRWLDLGCGHNVAAAWTKTNEAAITRAAAFVVGVDADHVSIAQHASIHARVVADIHALPFREESFNLVTANMVVEHVSEPDRLLAEVHRVLTGSGLFLFHTCNALNYHALIARCIPQRLKNKLVYLLQGRSEEDVYPTRYRINTANAIRRYAEGAGLSVQEVNFISSSAETVMLGPLVAIELLLIRVLNTKALVHFRNNIIAILRKPEAELMNAH